MRLVEFGGQVGGVRRAGDERSKMRVGVGEGGGGVGGGGIWG